MKLVKSSVGHKAFVGGRLVAWTVHREDGSPGFIVAMVNPEDLRGTDAVIIRRTYDTLAAAIRSYNAALPTLPEPPPSRFSVLDGKLADKTITQPEVVELLGFMRGVA